MACPCGTGIERYVKSFALAQTGENVDLHLGQGVKISHKTKKGHTLLAVLWANVLQHPKNFPNEKFIYTHAHDEATDADVLIVNVGDVQLMVYMRTGTLAIDGLHVFEWFVKNFQRLIDNFDPIFCSIWEEDFKDNGECRIQKSLNHSNKTKSKSKTNSLKECRSGAEEYLLLLTDSYIYTEGHKKRIMEETAGLRERMDRMSLTQNLWKGSSLSQEVSRLAHGGLRDGYNHIYKLWRSLLHEWFNLPATKVYMCAPCFDERCLSDIIDLFLGANVCATLGGVFTQRKCTSDPKNGNSFFEMKRKVMEKYDKKLHSAIEYRVYRTLIYPSSTFNCNFIAGVKDGHAQVLVTSADFNMDHFLSTNLEFVSVTTMCEKAFMEEFITPLSDQAIILN